MMIPQHKTDSGEWCPFSGCDTVRNDGMCPTRCADSERPKPFHGFPIVAQIPHLRRKEWSVVVDRGDTYQRFVAFTTENLTHSEWGSGHYYDDLDKAVSAAAYWAGFKHI